MGYEIEEWRGSPTIAGEKDLPAAPSTGQRKTQNKQANSIGLAV